MKKRCNFYIEEENIEYLHEKDINISQLVDDILSFYVDLLKKSENDIVKYREKLNNDVTDKTLKLSLLDKRLMELADEVDE
ncbi:MAG: hypothetical protein J6Y78_11170 [Paludibacteraceae bacterium]|nr:hypothetical protein [Paludibacteraceae bacterium]